MTVETPSAEHPPGARAQNALLDWLRHTAPLLIVLAISALIAVLALGPLLDLIEAAIEPLLDPLAEIGISETVLQTMLVSAILALSIHITLYGGMFSLANAGFMGIGAYVGALLTKNFDGALGASLLAGMLITGVIALTISLPVLRLRNIYLAIATIGFGEIVVVFFNRIDAVLLDLYRNNESLSPLIGDLYEFLNVEVNVTSSGVPTRAIITGGASGLKSIPQHTETAHLVLFLVVVAFIMYRLQRSRFGRALDAIRQDEKVAAGQGIHVVYYKNAAFFIGALIAAAAGVFDAHRDTLIEPRDYGFNAAVDILAYAVLGGTGNWAGPIIGGMTLQGLPELLRELREYSGVITGVTLLLTIVYLPGGLSSLFRLNFWRAGGRFRLASRVAAAGVVIILIANVLPYQQADTIDGRILGNVFWRQQAQDAPLIWLGLGALLFAAYAGLRWRHMDHPSDDPRALWRAFGPPLITGGLLLLSTFAVARGLWHLLLGNLLPLIALYWVLQTPRRAEGGRYALPLAAIAAGALLLAIIAGLVGLVENVMLGYYWQLIGLGILAAGAALAYPPEEADEADAMPQEAAADA